MRPLTLAALALTACQSDIDWSCDDPAGSGWDMRAPSPLMPHVGGSNNAHDGNQYQLTQERHDAIMELIEPSGIDDDRAPPV